MAFTIALDGPAASGKGTIGRELSAHFGFAHLDTGLLYRAVAAQMRDGQDPILAAQNLRPQHLERNDLRGAEIAQAASRVATIPQVRAALLDFQRAFARRKGGAVLDGRDIGTVVCPEAEAKLFVTASDEKRAARRYKELAHAGHDVTLAQVLCDVRARDRRDSERSSAPLKPASDAVLLDTTELSIADAISRAIEIVNKNL